MPCAPARGRWARRSQRSRSAGEGHPTVPSSLSQLRNYATHNGACPTPTQAEKAVLEVARIVRNFERQLAQSSGPDARRYEIVAFVQARVAQTKKDPAATRSTVGMPLVLGNLVDPPVVPEARLDEYRRGIGLFFG